MSANQRSVRVHGDLARRLRMQRTTGLHWLHDKDLSDWVEQSRSVQGLDGVVTDEEQIAEILSVARPWGPQQPVEPT